jgi:endonuclease/exonuclease/phosphatase family metal-dependent hydrolase
MKLKLLDYNILGGFYFDEIEKHLDFSQFDFICFQEFPFENTKINIGQNFNSAKSKFLHIPADDNVLGNATFYKSRFKHIKSKILKIQAPILSYKEEFFNRLNIGDTHGYSMNQLISHFQINNTKLTIGNLHLFWESDARFFKKQLDIVFDKLRLIHNPVILTGDFNTMNFIKRGILRKRMNQNGFKEAVKPQKSTLDFFSKYTFPSNRTLKLKNFLADLRILKSFRYGEFDYVFYKNIYAAPKVTMPVSSGSDHFPLIVDFKIP